MDTEKLRADLIMHFENFICSTCMDFSLRAEQMKNASKEELIKTAHKLNFNMTKYETK